eukprot:654301-Prymnesium_polylepis.1
MPETDCMRFLDQRLASRAGTVKKFNGSETYSRLAHPSDGRATQRSRTLRQLSDRTPLQHTPAAMADHGGAFLLSR